MFKTIITIKLLALLAASLQVQDIKGEWYGTLTAGQSEIGFAFSMEKALTYKLMVLMVDSDYLGEMNQTNRFISKSR